GWVQHVVPRGFVKIRHYGLLANRGRAERLTCCRGLLALWAVLQGVAGVLATGVEATCGGRRGCPVCGAEAWVLVAELPRAPGAGAVGPGSGAGAAEPS